jgi:peptidoglycan-associated lipoprotein
MTGKTRLLPFLLLAVSAAAVACSHKPPATTPTPTGPNQDSINAENARRDSIARAEAARRDSIARAQADADKMRNGRDAATKALTQVIYFDFDSDALKDDARSTLDAKIGILNSNPGVKLRVGGNTDERGSDEYNLALGNRRATAAKQYLVSHGIDAGRIETVSYGEERPIATGHDEDSWAQNRRDEFEILSGGDNLRKP